MSQALMSLPAPKLVSDAVLTEVEPVSPPTHDEIALEAYAMYAAGGFQDGSDVEHWLQAEQALLDRRARALRD